jgi:D-alanyl-D-alanine dipeptidase
MPNQITKILPKSEWQKVVIKPNGEPLVEVKEDDRLILSSTVVSKCLVREKVAEMLRRASELLPQDYNLVVVEGVRPLSRQKELWDKKFKYFQDSHPDWSPEKIEQETRIVIAEPSPLANHNCGGAVDVTLMYQNGEMVDMGTLSQVVEEKEKVAMFSKLITPKQAENRKILREAMERTGFVWYPGEWWHYCYGDRMWAAYVRKEECFYGPIEGV